MKIDVKAMAKKAADFVRKNGRSLDAARIDYRFLGGTRDKVLHELAAYQNKDGGFGNGTEPDFMLPASSPMATSVGLQILKEIGADESVPELQRAIQYLELSYDPEIPGWHSVPAEVNQYPHAPWWQYDEDAVCEPMGENWGNPSAELTGYLSRFGGDRKLSESLVDEAANRLEKAGEKMEPHELYCFLRLHDMLPAVRASAMEPHLQRLVANTMSTDPEQWSSYVPRPTDFIQSRKSFLYQKHQEAVGRAVSYLIETVNPSGVWEPTWTWGGLYPDDWKQAKFAWCGVLTVGNLSLIAEFAE